MAKIKPVRGKKAPAGPKSPGALGCLILIVAAFAFIAILLYYSIAHS